MGDEPPIKSNIITYNNIYRFIQIDNDAVLVDDGHGRDAAF